MNTHLNGKWLCLKVGIQHIHSTRFQIYPCLLGIFSLAEESGAKVYPLSPHQGQILSSVSDTLGEDETKFMSQSRSAMKRLSMAIYTNAMKKECGTWPSLKIESHAYIGAEAKIYSCPLAIFTLDDNSSYKDLSLAHPETVKQLNMVIYRNAHSKITQRITGFNVESLVDME